MALKRIIPQQDTFIVSASSDYNFGRDEILELGYLEDWQGISRLLMKFSSQQISEYLATIPESKEYKATLHLSISEAENLPTNFTLVASTIPQDWSEGIGRIGDMNTEGATWKYTGLRDAEGNRIEWDIPGGTLFQQFDGEFAIQGDIISIINNGYSTAKLTGIRVDGGRSDAWQVSGSQGIVRFLAKEYVYVPDLTTDIEFDVTDVIGSWVSGSNTGLLIRFGNETECKDYKSRISFYSKETHTIYQPYLEIKWDESEYNPGERLTQCNDFFGTYPDNLRREYTVGDLVQINMTVKDRYASRIWSTGSIYLDHVLPENSYWGIKDEYTNEMVIDFDARSTKISANSSGSFFILDTGNLEPERYYRLLIQVEKNGQKVIIDNRNIFRVGRNGKF